MTFTEWYNLFWTGKDDTGLEYPDKARMATEAYQGQYGELDYGEDEES